MKGVGIQIIDNTDAGDLMDLKIRPERDEKGLIVSGLVIGKTLEQNKALILLAHPGDFKFEPTLGVGIADVLLGDDLLEFRHEIREQFSKDGLVITDLDLYNLDSINIEAHYGK